MWPLEKFKLRVWLTFVLDGSALDYQSERRKWLRFKLFRKHCFHALPKTWFHLLLCCIAILVFQGLPVQQTGTGTRGCGQVLCSWVAQVPAPEEAESRACALGFLGEGLPWVRNRRVAGTVAHSGWSLASAPHFGTELTSPMLLPEGKGQRAGRARGLEACLDFSTLVLKREQLYSPALLRLEFWKNSNQVNLWFKEAGQQSLVESLPHSST